MACCVQTALPGNGGGGPNAQRDKINGCPPPPVVHHPPLTTHYPLLIEPADRHGAEP